MNGKGEYVSIIERMKNYDFKTTEKGTYYALAGGSYIYNGQEWDTYITPLLRPFEEIILVSAIKRDTLSNIREMHEFVVNIPPSGMIEEVMISARNYPLEVNEFVETG